MIIKVRALQNVNHRSETRHIYFIKKGDFFDIDVVDARPLIDAGIIESLEHENKIEEIKEELSEKVFEPEEKEDKPKNKKRIKKVK